MKTTANHIIMSAERSKLSQRENHFRTIELDQVLTEQGYEFIRALGHYQGVAEDSFMIRIRDYLKDKEFFTALANEFEQESILEIHDDKFGFLYFIASGTEEYLGEMTNNIEGATSYTELVTGRQFTFTKGE